MKIFQKNNKESYNYRVISRERIEYKEYWVQVRNSTNLWVNIECFWDKESAIREAKDLEEYDREIKDDNYLIIYPE